MNSFKLSSFPHLLQSALPIDDILPELLKSVTAKPNVVLHAPPGAGKSTRVPLALLDIISPDAGRIIMLEPRRLAAVSVARRMAACLGEEVGQTVGYAIRFDNRISASTRIEVITEGILTRRIQNDPLLDGVAMVIFDEFHERSIHADLGLALCRSIQQQVRPDLKILVMSATLDILPLAELLDNAPVISSAGRSFPVEEIYIDEKGGGKLPQRMSAAIIMALRESLGDVLAFLPGSGEIRSCAALLLDAGVQKSAIAVHQLYGDLPFAEQQRAIQPGAERKIVLATSIAETSLTIEGVRVVIDSGMSRRIRFDPSSGMNRLVTVRESRASAEQRKGRGGRLAAGVCYRLYSRHTFHAMTPHTPPEILEADLSPLLLELAAWGATDPAELEWLDPPPVPAVSVARKLLAELDAFDGSGRITPLGVEMSRLPLHPRLGRLLLRSIELGAPSAGCDIAALLAERDIFRSTRGDNALLASHSDISDRLEALRNWRANGRRDERLDIAAVKNVERVAGQLLRLVKIPATPKQGIHDLITYNHPLEKLSSPNVLIGDPDFKDLKDWIPDNYLGNDWSDRPSGELKRTSIHDDSVITSLLLAAYPDRLARRRASGGEVYLLANGRGARLSPRSAVRNAGFIIAVSLDGGTLAEALIHQAAEISEDIIRKERSRHITTDSCVTWDDREGRVTAVKRESLGAIQLSVESFVPTDDLAIPVVLEAVRGSGLKLLNLDEQFIQTQGRMALVNAAFPDSGWPDFSNGALLERLAEWLAPNLSGVQSARKLAQLDVAALLKQQLDYRQQRGFDRIVPTHLVVPSGSKIRVDYSEEVPVLAVKLQELFGHSEGPTVCEGRVALLLHLLSPAGRPIQVTRDLKGFWNGAYHQVKKELKGRYPKHPWPDDPWSAPPTRRLKPRS